VIFKLVLGIKTGALAETSLHTNDMSAPTELPADPKSVKKLEKNISSVAKAEEKKMQSAFKDMHKQERLEAKASKARGFQPPHYVYF